MSDPVDWERRLRAGLDAEVAGWSPELGGERRAAVPRPRRARRVQLAVQLAVVALLAAGGTGIAVGLDGGGAHRPPASLAAEPALSPTAADSVFESPTATPTYSEPPGCDVAAGPDASADAAADRAAYAAGDCGTASAAVTPRSAPSSMSAPPASTTPSATPSAVVPACGPHDLTLSVSSDSRSYSAKAPVTLVATLRSRAACDGPPVVIVGEVRQGSQIEESIGGYCGRHNGVEPKCPPQAAASGATHWHAGQTISTTDTWDQVTRATQPDPTYANPGVHDVTVTAGSLTATTSFTIVAPMCAPSQLTVALTSDASSYSQGQTATLTGTVTNTSATACQPGNAGDVDPTAASADGSQVWQACEAEGDSEQRDGSCVNAAVGIVGSVLQPGQAVTTVKGAPSFGYTWDFTGAGSTAASPKPLPDGTYTVSWEGLAGLRPATVSVTLTG